MDKTKIGEIECSYGVQPIYRVGDQIYIPVNSGIEWAEKFLTKEDWDKIADGLENEPLEFDLSVGRVKLELDDHPDGEDRGGYVPTLFFRDVRSYYLDDHDKTWQDGDMWGIQLYYDEIDGEWR